MIHALTDPVFYVDAEERHDRYPIQRATWNLYEEVIGEIGIPFLCVRIEAGYPLRKGTEDANYRVEPFWEVNYAHNAPGDGRRGHSTFEIWQGIVAEHATVNAWVKATLSKSI